MRRLFSSLLVLPMIVGMAAVAGGEEVTLERFVAPGPHHSPVHIWCWGDGPITKASITGQLERMQASRVFNAAILHLAPSETRMDSPPDAAAILSEEWWALIAHAVRECERLGMRLWFHDQLGTSGAELQARLVHDNPDYQGVHLRRIVEDVDGPASVTLEAPPTGTALAAFTARHAATRDSATLARWIAAPGVSEEESTRYFRRSFHLLRVPEAVQVIVTAGHGYRLLVNGEKAGEDPRHVEGGGLKTGRYDIAPLLRPGKNVIAVELGQSAVSSGLLMEVMRGEAVMLVSDAAFRAAEAGKDGWHTLGFDDSAWSGAEVLDATPHAAGHGVGSQISESDFPLGTPIEAVRNSTAQIAGDQISMAVPEGHHRVMLFYTEPAGVDYHNPEAGAALIDMVHGEMARRFPAYMGHVIAGTFPDTVPAQPHFSMGMPKVFQEQMGYDLIECIPALFDDVMDGFGDGGPGTVQVRCDAIRIAALLSGEASLIPLQKWHEEHGLQYNKGQTAPLFGEAYCAGGFKLQDHHTSGWGQTLEEAAGLFHARMLQGAGGNGTGAISCSPHGPHGQWALPGAILHQPYFVHYGAFSDYMARLRYVLSSGTHAVRVAMVHPANTVHAHTGFHAAGAEAQAALGLCRAVQEGLRTRGIDFIIVGEDSIARAAVDGGKLHVDDVALDTFVMPGTHVIDGATATQLNALMDGGGAVFMVGVMPGALADATRAGDAAGALAALREKAITVDNANAAVEAIAAVVPPVVAEGLPAMERRDANRRFFFLLSEYGATARGHAHEDMPDQEHGNTAAARGETVTITLPGDGLPEIWNAVEGTVLIPYAYERTGAATKVQVDLSVTPAPLLALRPANPANPLSIESNLEITRLARDADWLDIRGLAPKPVHGEAARRGYNIRVAYEDAVFEGSMPARQEFRFAVNGPFACRLEPTPGWPPGEEPPPVETRVFRYRVEAEGAETGAWARAGFDDSAWETVTASPGPPEAPADPVSVTSDTETPQPAWYRFRLPPGATGMQLRLAPGARATLHVGSFNIPLRRHGDRWVASLPMPEAEHRVAALRIESVPGYEAGAAILAPVTFDVGEGIIPLGSWDELGLPHYAGGLVYETQVYADAMGAAKWTLDLGRVRGTVALEINGEPVGVRLWHPYAWDVTAALTAGDNALTLKVYNTLGPHFGEGHPSQHVNKGQTKSGIFGPITLTRQGEYQTRLVKKD